LKNSQIELEFFALQYPDQPEMKAHVPLLRPMVFPVIHRTTVSHFLRVLYFVSH
jgi:hypothetical protein